VQIIKTLKPGTVIPWNRINEYMKKAGVPQFDYKSFKATYDSSPQLQNLVEFSPKGIEIKDSEVDDIDHMNGKDGDSVSKMAKRAVDLSDI